MSFYSVNVLIAWIFLLSDCCFIDVKQISWSKYPAVCSSENETMKESAVNQTSRSVNILHTYCIMFIALVSVSNQPHTLHHTQDDSWLLFVWVICVRQDCVSFRLHFFFSKCSVLWGRNRIYSMQNNNLYLNWRKLNYSATTARLITDTDMFLYIQLLFYSDTESSADLIWICFEPVETHDLKNKKESWTKESWYK